MIVKFRVAGVTTGAFRPPSEIRAWSVTPMPAAVPVIVLPVGPGPQKVIGIAVSSAWV